MNKEKLGSWAFLIGVLIAILAGLMPGVVAGSLVTLGLVILGLLIGLINVTRKESTQFLIAVIALLLASSVANLGTLPYVGSTVVIILSNIGALVGPAAIIIALKAIWETAKKK